MKFSNFRHLVTAPIFSDYQIKRLFSDEPKTHINIQLSRWVKTGKLIRLKRGLFIFPDTKPEEFLLANLLYRPSYVSLEAALNVFGLIPDVTQNITSITPITSKTIRTPLGTYLYSKIASPLYFGFEKRRDPLTGWWYDVALPEKALLDFIYVRKLTTLKQHRLDQSGLNRRRLRRLAKFFPAWVWEAINE